MSDDDAYSTSLSRMEWVMVRRNDSPASNTINNQEEEEEDSNTFARWSFTKVLGEFPEVAVETALSTALTRKSDTTSNSTRYINYFDRGNGRCVKRIFDTYDVGEINQTVQNRSNKKSRSTETVHNSLLATIHDAAKKRKRSDHDLWKVQFYDTAVITANKAPIIDDSVEHSEDEIATTMVDPRQLIPIYNDTTERTVDESPNSTKIPILITDTTEVYRLLAASQIHLPNNTGDSDVAVVEIGSSTGMTSAVIWHQLQGQIFQNDNHQQRRQQRRWIGLETGADMVKIVQDKLRKQNVNKKDDEVWATCHHIDPLLDPDTASLLVLQHLLSCRITPTSSDQSTKVTATTTSAQQLVTVLIDIGGNREEGAVLRMLDWVIRTFQSPFVVSTNYCHLYQVIIKSESIYSTLSSCTSNHDDVVRDNRNVKPGNDWYKTRLRAALRDSLPKHPLQAPKRFLLPFTTESFQTVVSKAIQSDEQRLICRYHNYHKAGCAKMNNVAVADYNAPNSSINDRAVSKCPFDHDHCHVCLTPGHIARHCPFIAG